MTRIFTVPLRLIFQLATKLRPAGLRKSSRYGMMPRHSGHVQVLDADGIQSSPEIRAELLEEVMTPIGHPFMPASDRASDFLAIPGPLGLLG